MYETCKNRLELNQQEACTNRPTCVFNPEVARGWFLRKSQNCLENVNNFILDICSQEHDVGPCRGAYDRFFYDHRRGACVPFIYGGCRGNQNNFLTLEDCSETCIRTRGYIN